MTKLLSLRRVCCLLRRQRLLKILPNGLVLRLLRRLTLRKVLRDGPVNCILRGLSRLERRHLCFAAKLTRRKPLGKLLGLRLVSKLTRLQGQLRVLRNSGVLRLLGLLLHRKLLAGKFCANLCACNRLTKPLRLCCACGFVCRHRLPKVLRDCRILRLLGGLLRLEPLQGALAAKLLLRHLLPKALRLSLILRLLCSQSLLIVLLDSLICHLLSLLTHAKRRKLCFSPVFA